MMDFLCLSCEGELVPATLQCVQCGRQHFRLCDDVGAADAQEEGNASQSFSQLNYENVSIDICSDEEQSRTYFSGL